MIKHPYLLFLGDAHDQLAAKTADGVAYWRPDWCLGQMRLDGCQADSGLNDMSLEESVEKGARTLIIGVANRGGVIPDYWHPPLTRALELGLDIAAGLHTRLNAIPEIREAADKNNCSLFDVRHWDQHLPVGNGVKRSGKRLITVGTDCSVGKMYAALAIEKEMKNRGWKADFRATGQTGILIAGEGISVDAVIADFMSGATEVIAPANDEDHWDIIEGQGSLFHPSFAGVTLALLHGAQADALVLCHEPTRQNMRGLPDKSLPDIASCLKANVEAAQLTNPQAKMVGIAINTKELSEKTAIDCLKENTDTYQLPCVDPIRTGVGAIIDNINV